MKTIHLVTQRTFDRCPRRESIFLTTSSAAATLFNMNPKCFSILEIRLAALVADDRCPDVVLATQVKHKVRLVSHDLVTELAHKLSKEAKQCLYRL